MKNLKNISNEFWSGNPEDSDFVIEFYTNHFSFFRNIKTFNDKDELKIYIEISCTFLKVLYEKSRFNDVVNNAEKILKMIEQGISKFHASEFKNDWYYGIVFIKGTSYYKLHDYKSATPIFKLLVQEDSLNDNYKKWLTYSIYKERRWLKWSLDIVSVLLIIIVIFLKEYIPNLLVRMSLLSIGLIGLLASLFYDYYTKKDFSKINAAEKLNTQN